MSFLSVKAAQDFTRATVVTTIHSTTESLSQVFFPAVTVCNINQAKSRSLSLLFFCLNEMRRLLTSA